MSPLLKMDPALVGPMPVFDGTGFTLVSQGSQTTPIRNFQRFDIDGNALGPAQMLPRAEGHAA
jgi:hypothetical protein